MHRRRDHEVRPELRIGEPIVAPDTEQLSGSERVDERLGEPQIRHRPCDRAVLDHERAVAGKTGYHKRLGVEDPAVVEGRHIDPMLHPCDQFVNGFVTRTNEQVRGKRPEHVGSWKRMPGGLDTRFPSRSAIVGESRGDPVCQVGGELPGALRQDTARLSGRVLVGIDHAGDDRRTRHVDPLGARWDRDTAARAERDDAPVAHDDVTPLYDLVTVHCHQASSGQRDHTLCHSTGDLQPDSRRVGGATYQVPVEVSLSRRVALAMRWLVKFSRDRGAKSLTIGLALEIIDAADEEGGSRGKGGAVKKRDETHRMAEANKAFSHYRW